jgi:hypothetical protein
MVYSLFNGLCWLLTHPSDFLGILGRNFVSRFPLFTQGGLGLSSEYALGSFGRSFLGKHADHKQQNTI